MARAKDDIGLDIDMSDKNEVADEEVQLAVRRAFDFLTACVDGKIEGAVVGDRIHAAQAVLQLAASRPDLFADLVNSLSGGDIDAVVGALA